MKQIDRILQKQILLTLSNSYPDSNLKDLYKLDNNFDKVVANIFYLQEHGLIENAKVTYTTSSSYVNLNTVKITAKGIDFLLEDGGCLQF